MNKETSTNICHCTRLGVPCRQDLGVSLGGGDAEAERGRIDPQEEFAQGSVSNTTPWETCCIFRLSILRNNLDQFIGGRSTLKLSERETCQMNPSESTCLWPGPILVWEGRRVAQSFLKRKTGTTKEAERAKRGEQARKPRSYASPKLCPPTHSLTHSQG